MNPRLVVKAVEATAGMSAHMQLVLVRLAALADKNGVYRAGQEKLAAEARCSVGVVKRVMAALDELGLIHREAQYKASGHRAADRVRLTLDQSHHVNLGTRGPSSRGEPSLSAGKEPRPSSRGDRPIEDTLKDGDLDQQFSRREENGEGAGASPSDPVGPGHKLTLLRGGRAA